MAKPTIVEERLLSEANATVTKSGGMLIQIITPGQGSSGYYSKKVVESAAAHVKPGTPMYFDHPTESDQFERPERSLRDLAAVFTSPGRWDAERGAVVAEAQVFAPYREVLAEMAPYIGVSVLGDGRITEGALPDGTRGRVIESIDSIRSVDFVTKAGRGGKVLSLLESARTKALEHPIPLEEAANVAQQFESRMHQDFTNRADDMAAGGYLTREERIHLSGAIGKALDAFNAHVAANVPHLYAREPYTPAPTNVPATRSDSTTTTESKEDTMPNIEETELARLREDAGRVTALEERATQAETRATAAETRANTAEARESARAAAAKQLAEGDKPLPAPVVARIVEAVVRDVPLADGKLDEAAFKTRVEEARKTEEAYLGSLIEATGAADLGKVTGLGLTTTQVVTEATRTDTDAAIAEAFGRTITKEA